MQCTYHDSTDTDTGRARVLYIQYVQHHHTCQYILVKCMTLVIHFKDLHLRSWHPVNIRRTLRGQRRLPPKIRSSSRLHPPARPRYVTSSEKKSHGLSASFAMLCCCAPCLAMAHTFAKSLAPWQDDVINRVRSPAHACSRLVSLFTSMRSTLGRLPPLAVTSPSL